MSDLAHPTNGDTQKDFLRRIDDNAAQALKMAVAAKELAAKTQATVVELQRSLTGNPLLGEMDGGRLGRLDRKVDDLISKLSNDESADVAGKRASRNFRISFASVVIVAIGVIASIILGVVH